MSNDRADPPGGPPAQGTLALPLEGPRAVLTPDAPTVMPALGSQGPGAGEPPAPALDPPRDPIDRAAPRHALLKLVGKGAMGEVYMAFDPELRRRVAFKRLIAELADNQRLAARFLTEVQVTAQLDHPNIVPINGMELAGDGTLGYSMKLVKGKDLSKLIEKWRGEESSLSRVQARERMGSRLDIFLRICEAMTYAHGKGVLHRDLKPENVMVGRWNDVYVMDWGLFRLVGDREEANEQEAVTISPAGALAGGHGRTLDGSVMGTPAYMSPEQAEGKVSTLDQRSDVYALGVILHELVSLGFARRGADTEATLELARRGVLAPLVAADRRVPIAKELRAIVAKATAHRVDDRYATARDLAEDVRRHLRGEAVSARPDTVLAAAGRALARHRMAALAVIAVLLLGGVAGVTWLQLARSRAALAAERREAAIKTLSVAAARHADHLDGAFYRWESLVARLVGHANEALRTPGPSGEDVELHFAASFDGGSGPSDVTPSRRYGLPISPAWPVVKVAPEVALDEAILDEARRAVDLRGALRDALLATADPPAPPEALLGEGVPGLRTFVTLANGVHVSYPGHGGYDAAYDGRTRDKYTTTAAHEAAGRVGGVHWGSVFKDRYDLGFVVPAGGALRDPDGRLAGVAGLEMSLDWIAGRLLPIAGAPWADTFYLLDAEGRVLVSVRPGQPPVFPQVGTAGEGVPITFPRFPHAESQAAVAGDGAGVVTLPDGRMAALYPLAAIDWTFVAVARADAQLW